MAGLRANPLTNCRTCDGPSAPTSNFHATGKLEILDDQHDPLASQPATVGFQTTTDGPTTPFPNSLTKTRPARPKLKAGHQSWHQAMG